MAGKKCLRKTLTLPDGSRKDVYAKSAGELKEKILTVQMQLCAGVDLTKNTTFGEYAELWYKAYKEPNVKQATREYYRNVLDNHLLPYMKNLHLRDIKPMQIQMVMSKLSDKSKQLNAKTLQTLRSIFDSAVDNNLIAKSPVPIKMKIGGNECAEKVPLTPEQETELLAALKGTRLYLFVRLGLSTGMRRGELCGLKWDCVDFQKREIHVRRNLVFNDSGAELNEYLKTEASQRDLPLTDDLCAELEEERRRTNSMFVFPQKDGSMLTESAFRSLWKLIDRRVKKEGTPEKYGEKVRSLDFTLTPHLMRHTFATRCFDNGLDVKEVQYLLGHTTPDITLRIYIHYQEGLKKSETFKKVRENCTAPIPHLAVQ